MFAIGSSHVEGDYTNRSLQTVGDGIFDNMQHLTFLHLGTFPAVEHLPSLSSLSELRSLTIAVMDSLQQLPSFDNLAKVKDLSIIHLPRVPTLPSLGPLKRLASIVIRPRSEMCCNGFISGTCSMTESQCLPIAGEKYPLICTSERMSSDDKRLLASLESVLVCPASPPLNRALTAPSMHSTDELCGGVKYKECLINGAQGICFNTRMMVVTCETTSSYIAMRRLQIQRGVGDPCDPNVESWLGCA
ncbi:unnamed protein product [Phytophthora fragariaefolia]|uniref:Unnamed protein product n=1 Tax=Phytophthora fragariaefolia TaxID=1490495 RepID=A0A9W7DDR8_9STRA|nr:unnamed protein product [Phytophthora fragariaefolia]